MERYIYGSSIFEGLSEYIIKIASMEDSYLVGGFIRDLIIGRRVKKELDIVMPIDPEPFAKSFAGQIDGSYFSLEKEKGVFCVVKGSGSESWRFDFSRMQGKDIKDDLQYRDFTMNALAVKVSDILTDPGRLRVLDPLGGVNDLEDKRIEVINARSFIDDPVRLFRAVRFSAILDFTLSGETVELIRKNAALLSLVSPERIRDELILTLSVPISSRYIGMLDDLGLLDQIIPEILGLKRPIIIAGTELGLWDHSIKTFRLAEEILGGLSWPFSGYNEKISDHISGELEYGIPRYTILKLSSLLHDIAKPDTLSAGEDGAVHFIGHEAIGAKTNISIAQRLRFGTNTQKYMERLTANHLRPLLLAREKMLTHRAVYRFFRDTGEDGISILIMALADASSKETQAEGIPSIEKVKETIDKMLSIFLNITEKDKERPYISGNDLINLFGLKPGPIFKEILADLREKQILGILANREDAIEYLRRQT